MEYANSKKIKKELNDEFDIERNISHETFSHFMEIGINIKDIKIISKDLHCSYETAGHYLERGTVVFEKCDLIKNLKIYASEWDLDDNEIEQFREMLKTNEPLPDWGFVVYRKSKYFIMYCL